MMAVGANSTAAETRSSVKKETAFSAVIQHACENSTAVQHVSCDTTRLWKQQSCGTALGPGPSRARQPCSAPLWETPSVFQLSLGDTAFTPQWEVKVRPASHRRAGLHVGIVGGGGTWPLIGPKCAQFGPKGTFQIGQSCTALIGCGESLSFIG